MAVSLYTMRILELPLCVKIILTFAGTTNVWIVKMALLFRTMFPFTESSSSSRGLNDRDDSDKYKCNIIVKWYQWENITLEDGKESLGKTSKRSPAIELYEALIEMLPGFL